MNCKCRVIKALTIFVVGLFAFGLVSRAVQKSVNSAGTTSSSYACFPTRAAVSSNENFSLEASHTYSTPLAYLFQILFFLFLASPPIIAVMLFLIWKELKEKNKLK